MSKKRKNNEQPRIIMITPEKFKVVETKREEEFVSMTDYDMLARAFDAAMDEIAMLRAKLKRVQEVITGLEK